MTIEYSDSTGPGHPSAQLGQLLDARAQGHLDLLRPDEVAVEVDQTGHRLEQATAKVSVALSRRTSASSSLNLSSRCCRVSWGLRFSTQGHRKSASAGIFVPARRQPLSETTQ